MPNCDSLPFWRTVLDQQNLLLPLVKTSLKTRVAVVGCAWSKSLFRNLAEFSPIFPFSPHISLFSNPSPTLSLFFSLFRIYYPLFPFPPLFFPLFPPLLFLFRSFFLSFPPVGIIQFHSVHLYIQYIVQHRGVSIKNKLTIF